MLQSSMCHHMSYKLGSLQTQGHLTMKCSTTSAYTHVSLHLFIFDTRGADSALVKLAPRILDVYSRVCLEVPQGREGALKPTVAAHELWSLNPPDQLSRRSILIRTWDCSPPGICLLWYHPDIVCRGNRIAWLNIPSS